MDEYQEAKSWTTIFIAGFWTSLWWDFFHSFFVMPKVLIAVISGRRENLIDHVVGQIALRANDATPPPPEFCEQASKHPRETMFLLGWWATHYLWFCPRIRIDVVTKISTVVERKWRFKGWID